MLTHRKNEVKAIATSPSSKATNHDPLKWFGVLVPQSLRQSQSCFSRATAAAVECAGLQSEILGLEARKKFLVRFVEKRAKEENE